MAIVGLIMLISTRTPAIQYIGAILTASGICPNAPMGVAWNGNNVGGSTKRAVAIAMQVGFGNFGGIIGAFMCVFYLYIQIC